MIQPTRGRGPHPPTVVSDYTREKLYIAASHFLDLTRRNWFAKAFGDTVEPYLARLLIGILFAYEIGELLTKKEAMAAMKAAHGKTSQRYIKLAEEKGLLKVVQSKLDERVDLLCPTTELLCMVKEEIVEVANDMISLSEAITSRHSVAYVIKSYLEEPRDFKGRLILEAHGFEHSRGQVTQIDRLTETISLAPENIAAYRARAQHFRMAGEIEKAIADLETVVKMTTAEPLDFQTLAMFRLMTRAPNRFRRALRDMNDAIRRNPDDPESLGIRGQLLFHLGEYERSIADFTEAIRLGSDYIDTRVMAIFYDWLGQALERTGKIDQATAQYRQAIVADPHSLAAGRLNAISPEQMKKEGPSN